MLRLIPVVDVRWHRQPFDWLPSGTPPGWVELGAECSDADVACVVATLASYNRIACSGSIEEVVHVLEEADTLVLPGGLMVRTGDLEIAPSCCCGLETWREWYDVAPGGSSPWLGHDPSPRVDCGADVAVMWADVDLDDRSPSVSVPYSEVDDARRSASDALVAFTGRLSDWLSKNAPQSSRLARRFAEAFDVS